MCRLASMGLYYTGHDNERKRGDNLTWDEMQEPAYQISLRGGDFVLPPAT